MECRKSMKDENFCIFLKFQTCDEELFIYSEVKMGSRDDFRRIDLKIEKMGVSHLTSDLERERCDH